MRTGSAIALALAAALSTTTFAAASPINTGVDVVGGKDQAWLIVSGGVNSSGYTGNPYVVPNSSTPPPDYPGVWATNPASNWDSPTAGATGNLDQTVNGTYVYQTTFSAVAGSTLSGMFAADNLVTEILLNGVSIYTGPLQSGPNSPNQYNVWTDFSGTLLAANTLTFDVTNYAYSGPNPTGLDVVFTPTPLPSTWTMLIAGFLGLGLFAFRGLKKSGAALSAA
jgi:hypothetical protein